MSSGRTSRPSSHPQSLAEIADVASVVVIAGSGGVGKTTTAAALGLAAAERGRRCVVVTVDPARRLADALGLGNGGLTGEPQRIDGIGVAGGELWAMMLDPAATFDALVREHSRNDQQVERILANRFYVNISRSLGGTQEYMAAEVLYALHHDERFDLVVVDTPPTRNALDVLDAPGRLVRFLDHRVYRALMAPSRFGLKIANIAAQTVIKLISRVVGGEVIADVVAFFAAFEGMEQGFKTRAASVMQLLGDPETRYVLVASPRDDTVVEAQFFAETLVERGMTVAAVVVNRLHPRFGATAEELAELAGSPGGSSGAAKSASPAASNLRLLRHVAGLEEVAVAPLLATVGPDASVCRVPLSGRDINDLDGLRVIGSSLMSDLPG